MHQGIECWDGFSNSGQQRGGCKHKGQGNYESLNEERDNIFFLLRAKCPLIAELLGVNIGDAILKHHVMSDKR